MTVEFGCLLGACLLTLVHAGAASFAFKAQVGNAYTVGPRDAGLRPEGLAGRLRRAQLNFLETFPAFAACVLMLPLTDGAGALSEWGCGLYLAGRIVYLPLYAAGIARWRTIAWQIAMVGLVLVGIAVAGGLV